MNDAFLWKKKVISINLLIYFIPFLISFKNILKNVLIK